MPNSGVVISSDMSSFISEREAIWAEFERSQRMAGEIDHISPHIAACAPARLQSQFSAENSPMSELESVIPLLKSELETINRLNAQAKNCYDEIENIKRREKTIIIAASIAIIVVLLILIVILFGS